MKNRVWFAKLIFSVVPHYYLLSRVRAYSSTSLRAIISICKYCTFSSKFSNILPFLTIFSEKSQPCPFFLEYSLVFLFLFTNLPRKLFVPSYISNCLCFYYADLSEGLRCKLRKHENRRMYALTKILASEFSSGQCLPPLSSLPLHFYAWYIRSLTETMSRKFREISRIWRE